MLSRYFNLLYYLPKDCNSILKESTKILFNNKFQTFKSKLTLQPLALNCSSNFTTSNTNALFKNEPFFNNYYFIKKCSMMMHGMANTAQNTADYESIPNEEELNFEKKNLINQKINEL